MKAQEIRSENRRRNLFEADVAARIGTLFRRWPTLCGFSIHQFCVTEVSVYPFSGLHAPDDLCLEITAALAELIDESPEAGELLRERSFARTFH
jgi:hypothetical protein